jgi:hypothetical protein
MTILSLLQVINNTVAIKVEVLDGSNQTINKPIVDWYNLPKLKAVDFEEKLFD